MKIDSVIKVLPINRSPEPGSFVVNSIRVWKELMPILVKLFQKIEQEGTLSNHFMRPALSRRRNQKRTPQEKKVTGQYPWWIGFPGDPMIKNPPANARDTNLIPGLGRSTGEGNGNQLQYSCPENPMDRGAWQVAVHGVTRVRHNLATKPHPTIHKVASVSCLHTDLKEIPKCTEQPSQQSYGVSTKSGHI